MDIVFTLSVRLYLYPSIFCTDSSERYKISNVQATLAAKLVKLKFIIWVEGVVTIGIVLYRTCNQRTILQRTVLSDKKNTFTKM